MPYLLSLKNFFRVILCHKVLVPTWLSTELILSQAIADSKKIKLHKNEDALSLRPS